MEAEILGVVTEGWSLSHRSDERIQCPIAVK